MASFTNSAFHRILAVTVGFIVTLQVSALTSVSLNGVEYKIGSHIFRDVCVVGGGSSGTYAAVRLTDMGKTVIVIEQKDRLGGHTETYTDPINGFMYDIGVLVVSRDDVLDFQAFSLSAPTIIDPVFECCDPSLAVTDSDPPVA